MDEKKLFQSLMAAKNRKERGELLACNEESAAFGLTLGTGEAQELIECRNHSLQKHKRVELGGGILDRLIFTFCDSGYIQQEDYLETLERLQDIFYEFKNLSNDLVADGELLNFMKEQFENICCGDLDYLEGTCLERFARAVRAGYRRHQRTDGQDIYGDLTQEQRWDRNLYLEVLYDSF